MENWKRVKGYDNYEVSDTHRVRNKQGTLLSLCVDNNGRYFVALEKNGKIRYRYIDELTQEAFAPEKEAETAVKQAEAEIGAVATKRTAKRVKKQE